MEKMNRSQERPADIVLKEQAEPLNAGSGPGLLETFNHALSCIIRHPKESPSRSSEYAPSAKKQRSLVWFPGDDVRLSSETSSQSYDEKNPKIIRSVNHSIKQEQSNEHFDEYCEWIDGNMRRRYALTSREALSHSSGWAMKYTNNHNKYVLKKTCVGVLVCSENCTLKDGRKIRMRPAISDKVRERQLGQQCPNSECKNGRIVHRKCTGNNSYPVTHFWVHGVDYIQFESKGFHDHPKPEAKRSALRKRDATKCSYNMEENMPPQDVYTNYNQQALLPYIRREDLQNFATYLDYCGEYVRSCDITDGNEHVCVATAQMRELAREMFSEENYSANFSKIYVLCRTLPNYIPSFTLLESRLLSCATPDCPLVLVTLYRSGSVDGILEHVKHLTVLCSSPHQKIRVPKWHYLVHDFPRELQTLAVETIVNLMVDTQMQTLLNEFQYKSVSSLYKMLRQRMSGTLKSFEEHYRICRYELMLRIQDARILSAADDMLNRVESQYCTAREFMNIDILIKDSVLGAQVREFWYFWGSDIISSAVFPTAKIIYDSTLSQRHHCSVRVSSCVGRAHIQDAFISVMEWLQKRNTLYPCLKVCVHPRPTSQKNAESNWTHTLDFTQVGNKISLPFLYAGSYFCER